MDLRKTTFSEAAIALRSEFDQDLLEADVQRFMEKFDFMGGRFRPELKSMFYPGNLRSVLFDVREELWSELNWRRGAFEGFSPGEKMTTDTREVVDGESMRIIYEDIDVSIVNQHCVKDLDFDDFRKDERFFKIVSDESLLRVFLLPHDSLLVMQELYLVALTVCGDKVEAKQFCERIFSRPYYNEYGKLAYDYRNFPAFFALQKFAVLYFRTKYSILIWKKVQEILKSYFGNILENVEIQFSFSQRNKKMELEDGFDSVNNGRLDRRGVNNFVIEIMQGRKLSPDDTLQEFGEDLVYSGIEDDFITILHESLHMVFEILANAESVSRPIGGSANELSAYYLLSEGFATFGEMFVMRSILDNQTKFDLGNRGFEANIKKRWDWIEKTSHSYYGNGVKLMSNLFIKYGADLPGILKEIDPLKLFALTENDTIIVNAVDGSDIDTFLGAIARDT